jgi:hypothetical protein
MDFRRLLTPPALTRGRIWLAYTVAISTDLLQLVLGPFGWSGVDEALDAIAMVVISWAIGFHVVLLPTFAIELLPVSDFLPTWTAAVAFLVGFRRRRGYFAGGAPPT